MTRSTRRTALALALALASCGPARDDGRGAEEARAPEPRAREATPPHPHPGPDDARSAFPIGLYEAILGLYATEDGGFRYEAMRADPDRLASLRELVERIGAIDLSSFSRDGQLAFYVNAYNLLVIHAVLARWPLESVMQSEGFFDGARYRVAGVERTLNELENDVIRAGFQEPRIHFALNCASAGCPPLARVPYTAANLEAMLAAQSEAFVRATTRIEGALVRASQLFEWFAADFGGQDGVRSFIAARLEGAAAARVRDPSTRLEHFEYDWALNARP